MTTLSIITWWRNVATKPDVDVLSLIRVVTKTGVNLIWCTTNKRWTYQASENEAQSKCKRKKEHTHRHTPLKIVLQSRKAIPNNYNCFMEFLVFARNIYMLRSKPISLVPFWIYVAFMYTSNSFAWYTIFFSLLSTIMSCFVLQALK